MIGDQPDTPPGERTHSEPTTHSTTNTARQPAAQAASGDTRRNLFWLTSASLSQVIIQFLIQVVLAYQFGAQADTDALAAALVIPALLSAIIAGSLSYVLVPDLVACFSAPLRQRTGWYVATLFGIVTVLFGLLATLIVGSGSAAIVGWLYSQMASSQQVLSAQMLGILSWQIVLSTIISWSLAVHHSRHSFIIPAMGGVWGTLATLILAVRWGEYGIHTIAIAINIGSLISAVIHVQPLVAYLRIGYVPREHLQRLLVALWPLVVGSIYLRIDPVVDRSLASRLDEGTVAHLHYAQRMIVALLAISTSGLSVIAFPQLAGHLARDGREAFAQHFALAMRRLILIVVPIAIGFAWFAVPVIADLLERGRFGPADSLVVGRLIVCFMGMFVGASWGELLARGFYTLSDTRTPTIVGAVALTLGLAAKWFCLPYLGVWGIALSTSGALLLSALSMSIILATRTQGRIHEGNLGCLLVASAAAVVACAASSLPYTLELGRTWLAAPVGAIVYTALIALVLRFQPELALERTGSERLGSERLGPDA